MRSRLETVSLSMQSIKLNTANGRRLRNYQRLTEEKTDLVVVENSFYLSYQRWNSMQKGDRKPEHFIPPKYEHIKLSNICVMSFEICVIISFMIQLAEKGLCSKLYLHE